MMITTAKQLEISKATVAGNPHHDASGRFASSGSSGGRKKVGDTLDTGARSPEEHTASFQQFAGKSTPDGRGKYTVTPNGHLAAVGPGGKTIYVAGNDGKVYNAKHLPEELHGSAPVEREKPTHKPLDHDGSDLHAEHKAMLHVMPDGSQVESATGGRTNVNWSSENKGDAKHVASIVAAARQAGFKSQGVEHGEGEDGKGTGRSEFLKHPDGHRLYTSSETDAKGREFHSAMLQLDKPKESKATARDVNPEHSQLTAMMPSDATHSSLKSGVTTSSWLSESHDGGKHVDDTLARAKAAGFKLAGRQTQRDVDGSVSASVEHYKHPDGHKLTVEREQLSDKSPPLHSMLLVAKSKENAVASKQSSVTKAAGVGCIMIPLPDEARAAIHTLQRQISPDNLVSLEDSPHVTVRYGVLSEPPEVAAAISGYGLIGISCGKLGLFRSPEFDVLIVYVNKTPELLALRDLIETECDCQEDTHPEYTPHVTIAYVKPGAGDRYVALDNPLENMSYTASSVKFSMSDEFDMGEDVEQDEGDDDASPDDETNEGESDDSEAMKSLDSELGDEFRSAYEFLKAEEYEDHTFVLGPVLVPDIEDAQGDIINAEEIEKAAHEYLAESATPGVMHAAMLGSRDAQVVESYITRVVMKNGDVELPIGTWMLAMNVYSAKLRKFIKDGKLRGFSIGGGARSATMEPRDK